jgi:hypothetical protein
VNRSSASIERLVSLRPKIKANIVFFQAGCCEGLSSGEVECVSASIFVNKSLATARKSRKVGALDLASNASSSGVSSEIRTGISLLVIILFFAS